MVFVPIKVTLLQNEPFLPGGWNTDVVHGQLWWQRCPLEPSRQGRWSLLLPPSPCPFLGTLPVIMGLAHLYYPNTVVGRGCKLYCSTCTMFKKKKLISANQEIALQSDLPASPKKLVNTSKWNQAAGPFGQTDLTAQVTP